MYRRPRRAAATSADPLPMNGSRTRSSANVYSRISCSGSSTGNGAGCPTRRALSGGICQMSSVSARKSSVISVLSWGRPSAARRRTERARSNRPLLATMTRSLMSRSTGLRGAAVRAPGAGTVGALRLLPDQLAAEQQPEIVLEDADHIGRQAAIRLAAQVGDVDGDAAAGLELAHAFGEHVGEHLQVVEVRRRDTLAGQLLLVLLAGEVWRRGHDERNGTIGDEVHAPGVTADEGLGHL